MAKHRFTKRKKPEHKGAPMRAEEAANTAGDPPIEGAPAAPMTTAPVQGAPMPAQAEGGSVDKTAPMSRMQKMYAPKRVKRGA